MSENKSTQAGTSTATATLLLIAFIVLKLTKVIAWSWWWVLSPFWIPLGIALLLLTIYGAFKAFDK